MTEVKILIEGYTSNDAGEEKTCPTISLIKDGELNIVVDPGILLDQKMLVDALAKEGLSVGDIDIVCITHSHIDHYRNIGMFSKAKTLEYFGLWDKNTVEDWKENFTENIKIIKTPGHNYDGITLLVKTNNEVVAVCGDVFWKENYPEKDPYASDDEKLNESREKVKQLADWIIPGHAGIYKIKK
ncbi:MAG: MBL fold metallo-hydrolase [Patescibacteria group bacterium]